MKLINTVFVPLFAVFSSSACHDRSFSLRSCSPWKLKSILVGLKTIKFCVVTLCHNYQPNLLAKSIILSAWKANLRARLLRHNFLTSPPPAVGFLLDKWTFTKRWTVDRATWLCCHCILVRFFVCNPSVFFWYANYHHYYYPITNHTVRI